MVTQGGCGSLDFRRWYLTAKNIQQSLLYIYVSGTPQIPLRKGKLSTSHFKWPFYIKLQDKKIIWYQQQQGMMTKPLTNM